MNMYEADDMFTPDGLINLLYTDKCTPTLFILADSADTVKKIPH